MWTGESLQFSQLETKDNIAWTTYCNVVWSAASIYLSDQVWNALRSTLSAVVVPCGGNYISLIRKNGTRCRASWSWLLKISLVAYATNFWLHVALKDEE